MNTEVKSALIRSTLLGILLIAVSLSASAQRGGKTKYTVNVTISGSGLVTSSTGGISCEPTCSTTVNAGTSITFTATPDAGATFSGWGGDCAGTSTTCLLTVDANKTVSASFDGGGGGGGGGGAPTITEVYFDTVSSPATLTAIGTNFDLGTTATLGANTLTLQGTNGTVYTAFLPSILADGDYLLTLTNADGSATWQLTYPAVGPEGPAGAKGDKGDPGDPGSPGPTGPQGLQGEIGPKGDDGAPGLSGQDGAAATVAIGSVTTLKPGSDPTVENSGSSSNAVLDFGLPTTSGPGELIGFSETTLNGGAGIFEMNRACQATFGAGHRMATSQEVLNATILPDGQTNEFAWIRAVVVMGFVDSSGNYYTVDVSGKRLWNGENCEGFSNSSSSYGFGLESSTGRFVALSCAQQRKVACSRAQ